MTNATTPPCWTCCRSRGRATSRPRNAAGTPGHECGIPTCPAKRDRKSSPIGAILAEHMGRVKPGLRPWATRPAGGPGGPTAVRTHVAHVAAGSAARQDRRGAPGSNPRSRPGQHRGPAPATRARPPTSSPIRRGPAGGAGGAGGRRDPASPALPQLAARRRGRAPRHPWSSRPSLGAGLGRRTRRPGDEGTWSPASRGARRDRFP